MDKIIEYKDVSFSYDKTKVLDNINLTINKGDFITIIGPNGSGKSTLIKMLLGINYGEGTIYYEDKLVNKNTIQDIRLKLGFIIDNPNNMFVCDIVSDEIAFNLENLGVDKNVIEQRIEEISTYLNIKHLLNKYTYSLSGGEASLVMLACFLVSKPDVLVIDEGFSMLDEVNRKKIMNYIKDLNKKDNITIINVTHEIEDSLYSNKVLVLDKGTILKYDTPINVFKDEALMRSVNIESPFMIDLSIKLRDYNLIDNVLLDMEELVNILWK